MGNIKRATAIYSGGGIYLYLATLTDGRFVFTSDSTGDDTGFIEYFDTNVWDYDMDELCTSDWYDKHHTGSEVNTELWNEMLNWIIDNAPEGNYSPYELYDRTIGNDDSRLYGCPNCKKYFRSRNDMCYTKDCHGITLRLVCNNCYPKLMKKGYDGTHYTEADENIDADY